MQLQVKKSRIFLLLKFNVLKGALERNAIKRNEYVEKFVRKPVLKVSISSTFYEQLLREQIPKAQKTYSSDDLTVFLCVKT